MRNLRLTKKQFKQIEDDIQVDVIICGIPAYCVLDPFGDFYTPSGVRFSVNYYAPTYYDLKINGEDQSPEEENE